MRQTPRAERIHIAIFGEVNAGKSSLINALTGQQSALVSEVAGTTTDPVYKAMELQGLGPVVFVDTAGFDDTTQLGEMRLKRTKEVLDMTDIAILVVGDSLTQVEIWQREMKQRDIPTIVVVNKLDLQEKSPLLKAIRDRLQTEAIAVSALTGQGIETLRQRIIDQYKDEERFITADLVKEGDLVLLVMPQDIQAPKGRLILPQVQTTRELLDRKCTVISTTTDRLADTLEMMKQAPDLIITDSQAFTQVYALKPAHSRLTSFSVLFAAYKGDKEYFKASAEVIDQLHPGSKVLIAEACTHAPKSEDIGTIKIPALLRKRFGEGLQIDFTRGNDFPENLSTYDLIIHCGSCMFNRQHVLSRTEKAKALAVPMSNYGMVLAKLNGILDKIEL